MYFNDETLNKKENKYNSSVSTDFHEEIEESMYADAAVSLAVKEDNSNNVDIETDNSSKLCDGKFSDNVLVEDDIIELLDYNKTIIENIENGKDLIAKAYKSFNTLQRYLTQLKFQNLELKKQIELLYIEKEKDVQAVIDEMLELEKDKDNHIEKLNEEMKSFQEEKNNKIKELENELLSIKQLYNDKIELLQSNLENLKLEKENEINHLRKEIERLQVEKEKDKKVLDEFQNMIRILEKIKGIFKKTDN